MTSPPENETARSGHEPPEVVTVERHEVEPMFIEFRADRGLGPIGPAWLGGLPKTYSYGVGSALDLAGGLTNFRGLRDALSSDAIATAADWSAVGADFAHAVQALNRQIQAELRRARADQAPLFDPSELAAGEE